MGAFEDWKNLLVQTEAYQESLKRGIVGATYHYETGPNYAKSATYGSEDKIEGLVSPDPEIYKQFSGDYYWNWLNFLPSTLFRTYHIYNGLCGKEDYEREGRNNLLLGFFTRRDSDDLHALCITVEGIFCARMWTPRKFLFGKGDPQVTLAFATYRQMVQDGYRIGSSSVSFTSNVGNCQSFLLLDSVKKEMEFCSGLRRALENILPSFVDCYRNNEELYEEAMEEIEERFPKKSAN